MSKGKFVETIVYGPNGEPLVDANVHETEITKALESSYFFGQFMAYYFGISLIEKIGAEGASKFMRQKVNQIARGNPSFAVKAEELEKSLMQYYSD